MHESDLTARITELEVKFSFLEEHVSQQDREILKLRTQLERQTAEIERLRELSGAQETPIRGDEKPPHY